ncbi:MAG TPA: flagellin [Chloroflexota bacterium]|nr:flagellin [Chloroflexota bacterium]
MAIRAVGGNEAGSGGVASLRQLNAQQLAAQRHAERSRDARPDLTRAADSGTPSAAQIVGDARGEIATQQRNLDRAADSLHAEGEYQAAAVSRIENADLAAETAAVLVERIRQQTTLAALAHHNVNQNAALRLLGFPG